MEANQPISQFRKNPKVKIASTLNAFNDYRTQPITYFRNESAKSDKLFSKIISKNYQVLDSFCGYPSYLMMDNSDDFSYPHLKKIFQSLQNNNFIKWFSFRNVRFNDAPFFYMVDLAPSYPQGISDGKSKDSPIGHGFGKDSEEVFSKAIGEFLERYFLTLYHRKNLIRGSAKSFKKGVRMLDLRHLAGFSDKQKQPNPRIQFDEESFFYWEKAKRWLTGETVYLPAQLIYWNYNQEELEPFLCEGNTSGAGGFFSLEKAIMVGLYELVQRDSFLIHWLNLLTPKKINPKTIPHNGFQDLLRESERYGFEIHCLNLTADTGIPVFAVVISDPSGENPRFCLGAGCQSDPCEALYRAFEEAWSVYYWIRPRPPYPALDESYRPFKEGIDQDKRLRLWANPEMARHFEFFISGKEESFTEIHFEYPKNFNSDKKELDFLVKKIEQCGHGYEVYYFQAKHPFLSDVGFYSVQVVVPQFVPLYLFEYDAPLGSSRLKGVPEKLGFKPRKEWNPLPHPFP